MASLKTSYEFTLPRGYVDDEGQVHRVGRMRLATARDELDPLRDPLVDGPDDPRLTILVLARVIEQLGEYESGVTTSVIEGLFAVDLAFLQDFYGVINFGTQAEFDNLLQAQRQQVLVGEAPSPTPRHEAAEQVDRAVQAEQTDQPAEGFGRPRRTGGVEELPRVVS